MAIVSPFKALRYDLHKINGSAADVICPPYDVIDAAMQNALYDRNPFNVVRVEFGKTSPEDSAGNDRYSRAAATFKDWIATHILAKTRRTRSIFMSRRLTSRRAARRAAKWSFAGAFSAR